jgi:hypothetical protein
MIDTSMLPAALLAFVVVADTHYMLDPGDKPLEFESRRKQSRRAEVALRQAGSLDTDLVFHMGDLVQEYPETERFRIAYGEAHDQLERCGISPHHVAGNQDIGDKPDGTMPCLPVTPDSLDYFHQTCGESWYNFEKDGIHFVVLNTQILNTEFREAKEQRSWFESELESHRKNRTFLFLHLPPFLYEREDPDIGNYDNIGQPDRTWLLSLIEKYQIEMMFAAHVHFSFYNRLGPVRFYNVPSTSFTRPGFSHLFAGAPPPEQGRDDTPKLGFYLCRVLSDRTDVHLIRTDGALVLPGYLDHGAKRLVTRTPKAIPSSPLGLSLLHPVAPTVEIPVAYPSIIRQRVRNDYPLLSCLELGISRVRFPASDLRDPVQYGRLKALRDEGVKLIPFHLWSESTSFQNELALHSELVDGWEIQIPGSYWPSEALCNSLTLLRPSIPITLASVVPGEREAGKQHPRTRVGYPMECLTELNERLSSLDITVDRALCRISGESIWNQMVELSNHSSLKNISRIDISFEVNSLDDTYCSAIAAEALFAKTLLPDTHIYYQPLIDFDRTMDVSHGLLNTLCNPRPAFHVLRCLNTILHSRPELVDSLSGSNPAPGVFRLEGSRKSWTLITSKEALQIISQWIPGAGRLYYLTTGTVRNEITDGIDTHLAESDLPLLIETG